MSLNAIVSRQFWTADRILEGLAVLSSFLYTFLYIKGEPLCWLFAFVGAAIFTVLCWKKEIIAESFLQLFYVGMAVYGYLNMDDIWELKQWPLTKHLSLTSIGFVGMLCSYFVLKRFTKSYMPLEDSFTTVFSIVATWVMVNYVHENYLSWMVIDVVSVHLYYKRGMYFGAILFAIYTVMVTAGYFGWM